ncbi:MAG: hypothetical protein WCQ99_15935 [Pseudomonadota bacterium]
MDKIEKLLELGTEAEKTELKVVHNAKVANLKAYNESKAAADLRNYEAADDKLNRIIEQLWAKYFHEDPSFENTMEVVKHLQEQGYAVKKSKVYKDAKAGLLRVEENGRINEISVRAYASGLDKKASISVQDIEDRSVRKIEAEIKRLDTQNKAAQYELDIKMGKYILRSDFEMEVAARAAVLDSGLRYFFQVKSGELIDVVGGDRRRSGDLVDMLNACLDSRMNDFADCERFQVIITMNNELNSMNNEQLTVNNDN